MAFDALPEGFRWSWGTDSVRIAVPPIVRTESHAYEPVLSSRDADALADAVARHERKRRGAGVSQRLARVRLSHDPDYSAASLARFRTKLSVALIEHGQDVSVEDTVTRSGMAVG